jgi:16S rRNA (guanine527-N7)-methyltransferase
MASAYLKERVLRVLGATAGPWPEAAVEPLVEWLETIVSWNKKLDLTAARDDDELVDLMVADAAVLAQHLATGVRVIDVGSGAGAPGLPLALLRPDLEVTLAEPLQKRAALLRTMKGKLTGARLTVVQEKGEQVAGRCQQGRWDVAISRATLPPLRWLELGARLGDEVWLFLARAEPPAIQVGWTMELVARYPWPLSGAERSLVRYRRAGRELAKSASP